MSPMISYVWRELAETVQGAICGLCNTAVAAYIQAVAGSRVPFLPASYFDEYPSPLQGLTVSQSGPFFCAPFTACDAPLKSDKPMANICALIRT